jgi:threonine/homoserine/homoserine lactone efflux protein
MDWLVPLVAFSAISAGTPGPNNLLLWASGAQFGVRRTLPHVLGTSLGIGLMALGVAAGLGALVAAVPEVAFAMKVAGSAYLLWLAWQIAGASALAPVAVARPLDVVQAAAFQAINPKGWIFALGAMATFRPTTLPIVTGSLLVAAVMMAVILPTAGVWAAAGGLIGRLLQGARTRRAVSIVLAVLLAASVIYVWL